MFWGMYTQLFKNPIDIKRMYSLLGITVFKSFSPYFRKDLLNHLSPHEFLLINNICISGIILLYFLFKMRRENFTTFSSTYGKVKKLSYKQYSFFIMMSLFTVLGSVLLYEFDQSFYSPLFNSMMMRIASILSVFIIGVCIYGESVSSIQILGIFLTTIGVLMMLKS